jgi:hypothetical protein
MMMRCVTKIQIKFKFNRAVISSVVEIDGTKAHTEHNIMKSNAHKSQSATVQSVL